MKQILFITVLLSAFSLTGNSQSSSDTLLVDPNSIIFFTITQVEFDSLNASDPKGGLNEVISDFDFYASRLVDLLSKDTTRSVLYTDHRFYQLTINRTNFIFDRLERDANVGMILNGTDRHKISWGVGTDVDMMQTIDEFFKKE